MTKIEQWHRRHAVSLAAQLPDRTEDGLIILRLAQDIVTGFLTDPETKQKAAIIVPIKVAP